MIEFETLEEPKKPNGGKASYYPTNPNFLKVAYKWGLCGFAFNVCKYAIRAGKKPGEPILKDLNKCKDYIETWIELVEEEENGN